MSTLNEVTASVCTAAMLRAMSPPDEGEDPIITNVAIAFNLGMTITLRHYEYVHALARVIPDEDHSALEELADALVETHPIVRQEVPEP